MKKYLMRGPGNIKYEKPIEWIMAYRALAANSGNMIYQNSVYQMMMNEERCEIDMDNYAVQRAWYSDENMDFINSEYDGYLCPMADVLRDGFMFYLDRYIKFLEKLTIPFYLIGVGTRAPFEPGELIGFECDDMVKYFLKLVLEHSSQIGLRGEITGQYLKNLGFREEKDFTVIGCPSMYRYGKDLTIRKTELKEDSKINVNFNFHISEEMGRFLYGEFLDKYPNSFYTGQGAWELKTLYLGHPYQEPENPYFPWNLDHPLYKQDRVAFHVDPEDWIYQLQDCDLSIGGRFHGNMAAILAGCPSVFMPIDARMRELTEYHKFPVLHLDQCNDPDLFEKYTASYYEESFRKTHEKNFAHYVDFLHTNGLEPVWDYAEPETLKKQFEQPPEKRFDRVTSYAFVDRDEQIRRNKTYERHLVNYWRHFVWKRQNLYKGRYKYYEKLANRLGKQLERKSVKAVRRFADAINSIRRPE